MGRAQQQLVSFSPMCRMCRTHATGVTNTSTTQKDAAEVHGGKKKEKDSRAKRRTKKRTKGGEVTRYLLLSVSFVRCEKEQKQTWIYLWTFWRYNLRGAEENLIDLLHNGTLLPVQCTSKWNRQAQEQTKQNRKARKQTTKHKQHSDNNKRQGESDYTKHICEHCLTTNTHIHRLVYARTYACMRTGAHTQIHNRNLACILRPCSPSVACENATLALTLISISFNSLREDCHNVNTPSIPKLTCTALPC